MTETHDALAWKKDRLASNTLTEHLAKFFESEVGKNEIIVTGVCPRCFGTSRTVYPKFFAAVSGTDALIGQGASDEINWDILVLCNCGRAHEGCPDDESGCGAEMLVRVTDELTS